MREQLDVNAKLAQLGRDEGIPLVATADAHYVSRQDAKAHDVLMCIASNKTFQDPKRLRHDTDGLFIQSPDDMVAALPDFREAIDNTLRIAEMCNVELSLGKSFLPRFQLPEGVRGRVDREALEGGARRASARSTASTRTIATPTATGSRWSSASSRRWGSAATSSSSRTSSTGGRSTRSRSAPAAAPARARSSPGRCASPTSTRSAGTCSSSGSSTPSACRCRTSTSTSARTGATRSSATSARSTARTTSARSSPSARSRRARSSATSCA